MSGEKKLYSQLNYFQLKLKNLLTNHTLFQILINFLLLLRRTSEIHFAEEKSLDKDETVIITNLFNLIRLRFDLISVIIENSKIERLGGNDRF